MSKAELRAHIDNFVPTGWTGTPTQTIVKNTFVDVVDDQQDTARLRRSASEGDLSKSSDQSQSDEKGYWLPSLWSSSNSSDKKRIEGIQGSVETTPWLYNRSALQPEQHGIGISLTQCYVANNPYSAQMLTGMASASASRPSRTRQPKQQKPPGIFQGGPPAPPKLKEPSATEEECMPSANFNFPPYTQSASSSEPVPPRRPSADVRSMLSTIWGHSPTDPEARNCPQSAYQQSGQSFDGHAPQTEGRRNADSDTERALLVRRIHAEIKGRLALEKLEELAEKCELASIPRNETNALTSVGSTQHLTGTCTPCAYWFKGICKYSIACHYCHFVHDGQKSKRLRPSKQTRMRIRKWEAEMSVTPDNGSMPDDEYHGEVEQDDEGLPEETVQRHLLNL